MSRRESSGGSPLSLALLPRGEGIPVGNNLHILSPRPTGERARERGLPAEGGAYALHLKIDAPLTLPIARLGDPVLSPGVYVYAGSAYGPGGIRARVSRHLRTDRKAHWHIDRLTAHAAYTKVEILVGGNECALIVDFLSAGATVPVPGFGSSDCASCASHLVRLAGE